MENKAHIFFNCAKCLEEIPDGMSPAEYGNMSVGWTEEGLQVWCVRHDLNVIALDFLGQKIAYSAGQPEAPEVCECCEHEHEESTRTH